MRLSSLLWPAALLASSSIVAHAAPTSSSSTSPTTPVDVSFCGGLVEFCPEDHLFTSPKIRSVSPAPAPAPALVTRVGRQRAVADGQHLTNAQRFARGLPPNPPVFKRRTKAQMAAKRQAASPIPPVTYQGVIRVTNLTTNAVGYVSSTDGAFRTFTPNIASALTVTFQLPVGVNSGTNINLAVQGESYPYLGFVQGRDSTSSTMASGSVNYLYLALTAQTAVNAVPAFVGNEYTAGVSTGLQRTSESAIWTVNVVTGAIAPVWTNPNGGKPTLSFFTQGTVLYAGGDQAQFQSRFAASPLHNYRLTFVPTVA